MSSLRNWKREEFARLVADGVGPKKAYEVAGFSSPERRNHNRLLNDEQVSARIAELKQQRENAARAARLPMDRVLDELSRYGVDQVADFFVRDAAGTLSVRQDLQKMPVEVSIALLGFLREGLGIKGGSP